MPRLVAAAQLPTTASHGCAAATRQGLLPRSFWGLRRPCLMAAASSSSSGGGAGAVAEPLPPELGGGRPLLMALALAQQE